MTPAADATLTVPSASLASLLLAHPLPEDEPLLHGPDRVLTAAAARAAAHEVAARLVAAGVEPGQPVAVQRPNDTSFVVAMFGVWIARAVFVPLSPRSPAAERAAALDATRPVAVIGSGDDIALRATPAVHAPDVAFVLWTSGTTGRPKPIVHTHDGYLELLDRVVGPLRGASGASGSGRAPTPNLIPVSLALNAGIYNVLFGLRAGSAIVVMDRFTPDEFATLVARHQIRSTVLPPAAITMLNDDGDIVDLAPLRYVRSITAPLSPLQARRFAERFGVAVLNGYGQAEIGEVIGWTAADARDHPDKLGAVGRAHPGVDLRIESPDAAGIGRLRVRPPAMAAGYASGEQLHDRIDADGYVDTGDLARIDSDGFVWIEGRANDLINRGGHKVFPEQVEEVLRLVPGVADAAVVGVADHRLGEVPVAYVVADASVTDAAIAAVCREHLAPYKIPVAFHRRGDVPRNEAGKLLRAALASAHSDPEGTLT
jgi:acyl-CoA synthetase (AMP-forming)/AMP-acid ligase II